MNILVRRKANGDDTGFSLIELAFVLVLVAILIGIAVPTFLGVRQRGQDRAGEVALRNALSAARSLAINTGQYPAKSDLVAGLSASEPSYTFVSSASSGRDGSGKQYVVVIADSTPGGDVEFRVWSDSQTCLHLTDSVNNGTVGPVTVPGVTTAAACLAGN